MCFRLQVPVFLSVLLLVSCGGGGSSGEDSGQSLPPPQEYSYEGSGIALLVPTDDGGYVSVLEGEAISIPLNIAKVAESIPVEISLQGDVQGISLEQLGDGVALRIDGRTLASASETMLTIIATNTEKDISEETGVVVVVLPVNPATSGTLTPSGGELISHDGLLAVVAEPGQLGSDVSIELRTAVTPSGAIEIRIGSDQNLSSITGRLRIERRGDMPVSAQTKRDIISAKGTSPVTSQETGSYPINEPIDQYTGLLGTELVYVPTMGLDVENRGRLASRENEIGELTSTCDHIDFGLASVSVQICLTDETAADLKSTRPESCFHLPAVGPLPNGCSEADRVARYQPVLFVHGYLPSVRGLGGGEGTWNMFPDRASAIGINDPDGAVVAVVPFEFRWKTHASFRVVADDLSSAIARIYELTERPVHIVAHSFGGVLVRTLLKNDTYSAETSDSEFDPAKVYSVLTLGTPHSGIFPRIANGPLTGTSFPNGQDQILGIHVLHNLCGQISCWQMGAPVSGWEQASNPQLYDAGRLAGEHIDRISALPISQEVPMVVGIGLERDDNLIGNGATYGDGDRLISFDGQRASPEMVGVNTFLRCDQQAYGPITEVVLGPLDENGFSPDARRPDGSMNSATRGYAHIGRGWADFNIGPDLDEYGEAYVEECAASDSSCESHAGFEIFRKIVTDGAANSSTGAQSSYCVAAAGNRNPSAPLLVGVVVQDNSSLLISWSPSVNGLTPYTYSIYDVTSSDGAGILIGTTNETSYLVSNLERDIEYCFQVEARDRRDKDSPRSNTSCATIATQPDATEGWLVFESGDPGVPNDGISVPGEPCPSTSCGYREFTPTERVRLGPGNSPITISAYQARFGFFLRFRLAGYPEYCTSSYSDSFGNGNTPPYDGVSGRFLVIDETSFNNAVIAARDRYPECMTAPISAGYISRIDVSTGGAGLDAAYLAYGANVFPDDNLPPISQDPGWVSFHEGSAGVPDDGVLVLGQAPCAGCGPQHSIVEEISLGANADGLTLSVYGTTGEALDEVVIRFTGFPETCEYQIPIGGALPNAPTIRGVLGKYLSLARSQLSTMTQLVAISNPGSCSGVSTNNVYYSTFTLSGNTDLVDGAFVGMGANSFPSE